EAGRWCSERARLGITVIDDGGNGSNAPASGASDGSGPASRPGQGPRRVVAGASRPAGGSRGVVPPGQQGPGLAGMAGRAGAGGGKVTAGPRGEGGFEVSATLPLTGDAG